MTDNNEITQCPKCGSFAWSYDDTVLCTDEDGNILDMDGCRCDDCDRVWGVAAIIIDLDDEISEPQVERDERGPFIWSYGHFGSGDPRDFEPDMELCTPEEVERWKADKARAEAGETVIAPPAGEWVTPDMHILAPKYGIGTYKYRLPEDDADEASR